MLRTHMYVILSPNQSLLTLASPQGIFQGRLMAQTFLEHILLTSKVPDKDRAGSRHISALITSIQVVRRDVF